MPGPLDAAGALPEPSEYATLSMDRHLTGLWTQRSPLRDADVPYLYGKFYSASRFDSLIDGINREITAKLSNARRPGSSVYNSNIFPAMNSFYGYRYVQAGAEIIRVIGDGRDGVIYDVTAGQKSVYFTKSPGAGKTRFLTVNNHLYMADGVDFKKRLASPIVWTAGATYNAGQWIIDPNGNIQIITTPGTVGGAPPAWGSAFNAITPDGAAIWTCKGNQLQEWQIPGPANAPTVTATGVGPGTATASPTVGANVVPTANASSASPWTIAPALTGSEWVSQWASTLFHSYWLYMTSCGFAIPAAATIASIQVTISFNIQGPWPSNVVTNVPQLWLGFLKNGAQYGPLLYENTPNSGVPGSRTFTQNNDGVNATWTPADVNAANFGVFLAWANGADSPSPPFGDRYIMLTGVSITIGYGGQNTGTWQYAYSYVNSVTADETTGSPLSHPVTMLQGGQISVSGVGSSNQQWDRIDIYRTAQGQPTPLFLAAIPNPGVGVSWTYNDNGTPDSQLLAQQAMLQNHQGDPPPKGFTAPEYHCGRIWGIVNNSIVYSQPLSPNGFAPLNFAPLQGELPIRLFAGVSSQGPTLFIWGTVNIYAILGDGTPNNPFTPATKYMASVGIRSYDCVIPVGSTYYALSSKRKFISLDPGAGYVEAGFPIGDQFKRVTTGAGSGPTGALYDPSASYVTWDEAESGDTALYVSDGSVGWFRFSPVASPESGYLWSPRAVILNGTSAVQSIEVSPGVVRLLIAPQSSGSIRMRDTAVNGDWDDASSSYLSYPSWDVKGNIVLCQSGQVAEIAHIALKSMAVGSRPIVSLLLGEISPTQHTPFDPLVITSTDPPDLPPSETMYSDRYSALQNGNCPKCDNFQLKVDYGSQNVPDELLMFEVYGAKHAERRQQ